MPDLHLPGRQAPAGWRTRIARAAVWTVGLVLLAGLWVGVALVVDDWLIEGVPMLLARPPDSVGSTPAWLWAWLWVVLYGLGGPALLLTVTLYLLRARDVLDGTVLTVRGPFRTRSADLAVARVRGEVGDMTADKGLAEVLLIAEMPGGDRPVRLVLGDSGGLLPRPQLAALADAIAAGDPDDPQRQAVVERLRLFVRQPFAVPRHLWRDPPPR